MREIIASVDIGSSKIKMVVAEVIDDRLHVLTAVSEEARGVSKGLICEPDETIYALKKLLKKAEDQLGIPVKSAIVSVSEESSEFKIGEASISISSIDKEITASDIIKVMQASTKGQIENEMDLVTVMPIMFKVDDKKTRLPKGMHGSSLTVRSVVVSALKKDIYLAAKCLEKCGVEVVDIMIPSIGSYFAHKNESTDTSTGIVIDCGSETINMSVFNKGIIVNNVVMPIGGINVDNDISFVYKLNEKQSKEIKENFGVANKKNASSRDKEIVVNKVGDKVTINQAELADIVMGRLHEMLNMAKNQINYLTKKEISYIIITGGLTELKDFALEIESVFGRDASLGKISIIGCRSNEYANCIGMIKYFDYKLKLREREYSSITSDDEEILSGKNDKKILSGDSILGRVFGLFFDN